MNLGIRIRDHVRTIPQKRTIAMEWSRNNPRGVSPPSNNGNKKKQAANRRRRIRVGLTDGERSNTLIKNHLPKDLQVSTKIN